MMVDPVKSQVRGIILWTKCHILALLMLEEIVGPTAAGRFLKISCCQEDIFITS
jgi:hypothetical protein